MASPIEEYIRQSAIARGINPDVAVRVANAEGGLQDPTRQSLVMKGSQREPSYGPFQLLIGGPGTGFPEGLGNRAVQAGIDPRNPNHWQKGVDFALDEVNRRGWGQWYGAKAAGIDNWAGVRNQGRPMGGIGSDYVASNMGASSNVPGSLSAGMNAAPQQSAVPDAFQTAMQGKGPTFGDRIAAAFKSLAEVGNGPSHGGSSFPGGPSPAQINALPEILKQITRQRVG